VFRNTTVSSPANHCKTYGRPPSNHRRSIVYAPFLCHDDFADDDEWMAAMNQQARARQRAEKRAAGKIAATQGESLLKKLKNFAADFGAEEFENFREQMDRLFGPRKNGTAVEGQATRTDVQSNIQSNVEAQSQLKTEFKAEAAREIQSQLETEPAFADAEAHHPVSQS
jgi:hypothetical protein